MPKEGDEVILIYSSPSSSKKKGPGDEGIPIKDEGGS